MAIISGNFYFGGKDHNDQIVSAGVKDVGSPLVSIGNSLTDSIEPPDPSHSFGKACVSTCGSRIVAEVHPDPNNLYESYLAFYDTETLQPVGLGTTNPGPNSILRYELVNDTVVIPSTSGWQNIVGDRPQAAKLKGYAWDQVNTGDQASIDTIWQRGDSGSTYYRDRSYQDLPDTGPGINTQFGGINYHRIEPVDKPPIYSQNRSSSWVPSIYMMNWLRPHGMVDWYSTIGHMGRGTISWSPMNYETVVHSPVPLRDKIVAIVEYKVPWTGAHGHGRYNDVSSGHYGIVCLGVFGLDGEVIAIHDLRFSVPSKMYISSKHWRVQSSNGIAENYNIPNYETRMVSMGEYGSIKLSAHNGMVAIGCTFNQAHMYDTGTFDLYGPGDGVYLFRLGDSRRSMPRYFTVMRPPTGSYIDFFPEHLDMGSNYLVATGVPRGTGATSSLFDQSTGERRSTEYLIKGKETAGANFQTDFLQNTFVWSVETKTDNTDDVAPYYTGINTSPHASEPYVRLYNLNGLLETHIGSGTVTDVLSYDSTDDGYPILNYDNKVKYVDEDFNFETETVSYQGLSDVSLGSGKLVIGIGSAVGSRGMVDIYNLKSSSNALSRADLRVHNESSWGSSVDYRSGGVVGRDTVFGEYTRMIQDSNYDNTNWKHALYDGYDHPDSTGGDKMGNNVLIASQRIVVGSPDGDTLFDGNSFNIKYSDSGKIEMNSFDMDMSAVPDFSSSGTYRYDDDQEITTDKDSHQYLFDSKGVLAGYATTQSRIEAKDFRSGVLIIGTGIGSTPARMKILVSPTQDTILDILGEK